jgi:choloylglycine hydrolase
VDLPYGAIRSQDGHSDYTQWIVVKDLTNKKFYCRTYGDQNIQTMDLSDGASPKIIELTAIEP